MLARHRLGHEAAAEAAQQRLDLGLHVADRQHVLAGQQVDGERRQALRRIGDRDGAVADQLGVGERLCRRAASGWCGATAKTNAIVPSSLIATPLGTLAADADADRQIGLAGDAAPPRCRPCTSVRRRSRVPAARARSAVAAGVDAGPTSAARCSAVERLAQLEHRRARDDAVDGDR